jgi:hypothetical protein
VAVTAVLPVCRLEHQRSNGDRRRHPDGMRASGQQHSAEVGRLRSVSADVEISSGVWFLVGTADLWSASFDNRGMDIDAPR